MNKNNKHAFPQGCKTYGGCEGGMTLRDYFAAHALPAIYAEYMAGVRAKEHQIVDCWRDGLSMDAYAMADAMLRARNNV